MWILIILTISISITWYTVENFTNKIFIVQITDFLHNYFESLQCLTIILSTRTNEKTIIQILNNITQIHRDFKVKLGLTLNFNLKPRILVVLTIFLNLFFQLGLECCFKEIENNFIDFLHHFYDCYMEIIKTISLCIFLIIIDVLIQTFDVINNEMAVCKGGDYFRKLILFQRKIYENTERTNKAFSSILLVSVCYDFYQLVTLTTQFYYQHFELEVLCKFIGVGLQIVCVIIFSSKLTERVAFVNNWFIMSKKKHYLLFLVA